MTVSVARGTHMGCMEGHLCPLLSVSLQKLCSWLL